MNEIVVQTRGRVDLKTSKNPSSPCFHQHLGASKKSKTDSFFRFRIRVRPPSLLLLLICGAPCVSSMWSSAQMPDMPEGTQNNTLWYMGGGESFNDGIFAWKYKIYKWPAWEGSTFLALQEQLHLQQAFTPFILKNSTVTRIKNGFFLWHKHRKGLTTFLSEKYSHPPTWKKWNVSNCGFWTSSNTSVF